MIPYLNYAGYLPLTQPYNTAPWNYTGTESVTTIPNYDIVDWILLELRDAPTAEEATSGTTIATLAAFLRNDGKIVSLDGISNPRIAVDISDGLFIVIRHRNHLAIMNSTPLDG